MENVKRTVEISSNIGQGCDHCDEWVGASMRGNGGVATSINHYIEAHGYKLLHVGSQTSRDDEGKPWHSTVAILGHDDPPALKPPVEIVIGGSEFMSDRNNK